MRLVNAGNIVDTKMSNMNGISELYIVIPQHPWLYSMAKAVPWTIEHINSVTLNSVNLYKFEISASVSKCFHIELIYCSDVW
jgi:hypothetical protein